MVDNDWFDVNSSGLRIGTKNTSWQGFGDALGYLGDMFFGTNFMGNKTNQSIANQNIQLQKETNAQNEALLRESWARDDTAVQRRVADLKAAGLSPTLAAGSAAASSSPIQLKAPQNEFHFENPFNGGVLNALTQIMAIKNAELQNKLLEKQVDTYGEPAWFKALNAILDKFGKDDGGPVTQFVYSLGKNFVDAGPIRFNPAFGFTFAAPPSNSKAASTAIGRSAAAHGATFDESTMIIDFPDAESARKWYIDIGGTSYEWYYGVKSYDNDPAKFIRHIIEDGYITRDGDVYLDR